MRVITSQLRTFTTMQNLQHRSVKYRSESDKGASLAVITIPFTNLLVRCVHPTRHGALAARERAVAGQTHFSAHSSEHIDQ